MERQGEIAMQELLGRIGDLTSQLLEEGADAAEVAFVLTSIAVDMGMQVTGEPLKVFPVLLRALADQAERHRELGVHDSLEGTEEADSTDLETLSVDGMKIH